MKLSLKIADSMSRRPAGKRARRRLISREKARCKRQKVPWRGKRQTIQLSAPYAFAIDGDQNRKTCMRFFSKLREAALERRQKIIIDFAECEVTAVSGTLMFVAEIDRIKRILGDQFCVSIINVKNRRVDQLLYQIGVYSLCDIKKSSVDTSSFDESVRHWRYATGERINEQANKAFQDIEGLLTPELAKGMWKSVSEAVVNSVEHAYIAPRGVNGPRMGHSRWWMFSQEKDGFLTVAVCDLGIGIPRSLPINWQPSILTKILSAFGSDGPDVRAVKAALVVGASSTQKSNRGKGLPQIWNTLRNMSDASVAIMSNKARLVWNGKSKEEFSYEFGVSINGTVIIWTVPVVGGDHVG